MKVNLAITLFYLIYRLLLSNRTPLRINRMFLLGSMAFSFILPLIQFPELLHYKFNPIVETIDFHYFDDFKQVQFLPTTDTIGSINKMGLFPAISLIYLIISLLFQVVMLENLVIILHMIFTGKKLSQGKVRFIISEKYASPFSFFNCIFTKSEKNIGKTPEFLHELAHVQQLHSIDRLLVELLIPLLWINPFIYLFRKSIIEVHEHLADNAVIQNGVEPIDYQNYLFSKLKSGQYLKMTSNFNYSLTKKRIMMISNKKSKNKISLRISISLIAIAMIVIFYGFSNKKQINPLTEIAVVNQIVQQTQIPSILPLKESSEYLIASGFGNRKHPISGKMQMHNGIDITAAQGTPVIAPAEGLVIEAEYNKDAYGNRIKIQHGEEYVTVYAHLSGFNVKAGDKVKAYDVIGYVGSTGLATRAHLHYEIRKFPETEPISYLDPMDFIQNIKKIPQKHKSN